ncbi:MAG: hypothetical protein ACK4YQ_16970 [Phenylobacterium sp.]|uniref:hypothetical protein n=1 Tax=Phenylobacterium sp. TaxID=1871053 RepID=UPI00391A9CAF
MVDTVTFPPSIGGTGETFTSGSDPATGMASYGYVTRFFKILANVISVANFVATKASEAAAAALTALNAPGTTATSVTSNNITGAVGTDKTFQIQSGKTIVPGMVLTAARTSAAATQSMTGVVQSYSGTTLVLRITSIVGSGTSITDWTFHLAATGAGATPSSRTLTGAGLVKTIGDLTADRTVEVEAATVADVRAGTSSAKACTPAALAGSQAFQTLTDGATISWNVALGFNAKVTIAGDRTMGAPTNLVDGQTVAVWIKQDATGGRTITWNSIFDFDEIGYRGLSGGAGKVTKFWGQYSADTGKIHMSGRKAA